MTASSDTARRIFVTGLQNVHAVEHQALALIDRQLDRLEHYPDVAAKLKSHRRETEAQIERVERILTSVDETPSAVKDTALALSGNLAALVHTVAPDEILKNTLANLAFENFEAGSYLALVTMAQEGGFQDAIGPLTQSLEEETAMAKWVGQNVPAITRAYISREERGQKADR
jgi:ferritin-like metal-binding protein YciE